MSEHAGNSAGKRGRLDDSPEVSEQVLREVFASAHLLMVVEPCTGGSGGFSPGWEHFLGYTGEDLRAMALTDLIHAEDQPAAQASLEALRVGGEPFELDSRCRHRDGSYRWLRWRGLRLSIQDRMCVWGQDITAQKLAEHAIAENQRRFSMATRAASVAVWEIDTRSNATYFSPQWQAVLGYEEGTLNLDFPTWSGLCDPHDFARLQAAVAWVSEHPGTETFEIEHRMLAKDGTWLWIMARGTVVERDASGQAFRFCGTSIDITQRKRVEAELQRLVAIVDESPLLVSTANATSMGPGERLTYMNAAGRKLLGLPEDCLERGIQIQDVHPAWAMRLIAEQGIPAACRHGSWHGKTAVVDCEGREMPVQQLIVAHRGAGGEVEYLSTIMRDLTEQMRSEQALRESEQRFRTFFECAPNPVTIQDLEGRFVDVNRHYLETNGVERAYVMGQRAEELPRVFAPERTAEWELRSKIHDRQLVETGSINGVEVVCLRRSDGQRRTMRFSTWLITLDGQPRTLSVGTDVTEFRQMERQMRQAQKMDAIGRLAGGVAHDFNNLLTVIGGYTDMALRDVEEGHPMHARLMGVNRAALRANQLTRQLLAFSRSEAVAPSLLDLNTEVAETERMLRRLIGEHIVTQTELGAAMPTVRADSGQIAQVLMNLVVNARDAMPGGGHIDIATLPWELDDNHARALALAPGRYACLRVADTGTGMDEETLGKIFEPFFTTKGAGQGTGLGLSIVYGIVKQCGGGIQVESHSGAGTCFEVFFPAAEEVIPPVSTTALEEIPRGTGTVLLVEDDPALRDVAQQVLSNAGYQVLSAGDGQQALLLFQEHAAAITILLTDMALPGLGGRALSQRLAAAKPSLTIVFMSGYSSDANLDDIALGECDDFIRKPFLPPALLKTIQHAVQKRAGIAPTD